MPLQVSADGHVVVVARASTEGASVVGTLTGAIRDIDPDLVVDVAGTGWKVLSGPVYFLLGVLAAVSSGLGLLTLVLVMTGLYGVLSTLVAQRQREWGIRMAMGSSRRDLLRLVFQEGWRPARTGLIVGMILGVLSRVALGAITPQPLSLFDPVALVIVPVTIVIVTVVAVLVPASRASSVDPNAAFGSRKPLAHGGDTLQRPGGH